MRFDPGRIWNHSPLATILHWHYVRYGELFSSIPLMGLGDHIVNGGMPFDLPALKPFFMGENGLLPKPEEFAPYAGFLDAHIRYDRVKALLESVAGFTEAQAANHEFIPGDAVIREFIGAARSKSRTTNSAANSRSSKKSRPCPARFF